MRVLVTITNQTFSPKVTSWQARQLVVERAQFFYAVVLQFYQKVEVYKIIFDYNHKTARGRYIISKILSAASEKGHNQVKERKN